MLNRLKSFHELKMATIADNIDRIEILEGSGFVREGTTVLLRNTAERGPIYDSLLVWTKNQKFSSVRSVIKELSTDHKSIKELMAIHSENVGMSPSLFQGKIDGDSGTAKLKLMANIDKCLSTGGFAGTIYDLDNADDVIATLKRHINTNYSVRLQDYIKGTVDDSKRALYNIKAFVNSLSIIEDRHFPKENSALATMSNDGENVSVESDEVFTMDILTALGDWKVDDQLDAMFALKWVVRDHATSLGAFYKELYEMQLESVAISKQVYRVDAYMVTVLDEHKRMVNLYKTVDDTIRNTISRTEDTFKLLGLSYGSGIK